MGALAVYFVCVPYLYRKIKKIEDAVSYFFISAFVCNLIVALLSRLTANFGDTGVYGGYFYNYSFIAYLV